MVQLAKKPSPGNREALRRARLGDLTKLYRSRYGPHGFPDDCAGREDLLELLYCTSMAPTASEKRSLCIIELWAPWMPQDEAERLVRHMHCLTFSERTPTARTLGNRVRLTNAERERLRLWTIKPFDMTDDQLVEQSKARERARRERKRRDTGVRIRAAYLAEQKAKPKPWTAEGIDRATWYRRRAKAMRRGRVETRVTKEGNNLVAVSQVESQQGYREGVLVEKQRKATEAENVERTTSGEPANRHDLVAHKARMAAMKKWGANRRRTLDEQRD
jgi:hypothetical protein